MRIILAPVGTRGDVQPLVAQGRELQNRGHGVLICGPVNFESFVRGAGLAFAPGVGDYARFMEDLKREPFLRVLARQVDEQFALLSAAAPGADAIVGSMLQLAGPSVAEHLGIPYYIMHPAPVFIRSDEHPPVTLKRQTMGLERNRCAWERRGTDWNRALLSPLNRWRAQWGLASVVDAQDHALLSGRLFLACEPALVRVPRFAAARVTTTGTWFYEAGELDPSLVSFCEAGTKPLFIGFGSMMFADPKQLLRMIVQAVKDTGIRAVIGSGWLELEAESLPPSCHLIKTAPFHLLLPRMRAAIHHGGAGTVAATALAGIPQGIVPHFADQFYWGHRLHQLGLAPRAVPIHHINTQNLSQMIRSLLAEEAMHRAAVEVSRTIDPARGVTMAASIIEQSHRNRRRFRPAGLA